MHLLFLFPLCRFGERAKRIKNHAKVNEELSAEELKALLAAARREIAVLKKRLAGGGALSVFCQLPMCGCVRF